MTIEPVSSSPPPAATLLNIKIRFSHSDLPDLPLLLPFPGPFSPDHDIYSDAGGTVSTVNNLKGRIRASLPEAWRKHGLKLIHAGRVLDGRDDILRALRVSLPATRRSSANGFTAPHSGLPATGDNNGGNVADTDISTVKGKGKGKALPWAPQAATATPPIYIHCAVTPTPLDPRPLQQQLALEAEPAPTDLATPAVAADTPASTPSAQQEPPPPQPQPPQQQPVGFDRLLAPASGFNPSDVSALRAQFRAIIGNRYTPDTMPGAGTLLRMEEAWLDDSSSLPPGTSNGPTAATAARDESSAADAAAADEQDGRGGYTDDDAAAALDDTFYGVFMGFFWPLGACVWGMREEGVWSRRRGWAVLAGVMVNVGFGVVRVLS